MKRAEMTSLKGVGLKSQGIVYLNKINLISLFIININYYSHLKSCNIIFSLQIIMMFNKEK